ncbi:hypothetical protein ACJX0J_021924, partial [Zea mays]
SVDRVNFINHNKKKTHFLKYISVTVVTHFFKNRDRISIDFIPHITMHDGCIFLKMDTSKSVKQRCVKNILQLQTHFFHSCTTSDLTN